MNKKIVIIKGDGIGPEVVNESVKILNAIATVFNHSFTYQECLMGAIAIDETGVPLPQETIDACNQADAILFGAIGHPKYDNDPNAKQRPEQGLLALRKALQLYANIRPVSVYSSLKHLSPLKETILQDVDFVIYRELTSGIYFGKKFLAEDGSYASDECLYKKDEIEKIAHLAFKAAQQRSKKLTLVDKANVLETSRLWRKTVIDLATNYPDVQVDYLFVDNAAMQIITNPKQFDVMLTENMFGDILSDEASVISGSLGMLPSASIGNKLALFEPIHGSYPQATGLNIANPLASILSAAMMLDYFNLFAEANLIRAAVQESLSKNLFTKDLNPNDFIGTNDVGNFIEQYILKHQKSN
ncbi:MAG: 3-isopropylmalate dehydrogenase [Chitinophagaceae bacterium]